METTFIKINSTILSSTKLTLAEKVLISIILSFQNNKQTCTKSNQTLAQELSMSEKSLKRMITKLNKTKWFLSSKTSKFNENGKWNNSKEMKINVDELLTFLDKNEEEKLIELPSIEIKKETLKPQVKLTQEKIKEKEILESLILKNNSETENSNDIIIFKNNNGDEFLVSKKYKDVIEWCSKRKKMFEYLKSIKSEICLIMELENNLDIMNQHNQINQYFN